ncbi:hypothetical protein WME97_27130 [Sorangium sp. So ce367]|uniref:hypothetical protein n=1 Tax=Sorangium sp. So ce367 TaxID=3133305 RepID=UPI003F600595
MPMRATITSLGMISPVGLSAIATAAAVRAALSFPAELDLFDAELGDEADARPVRGHPIHDFTEGFHLFGRWVRMAAGCLDDLVTYGDLDRRDTAFWRGTGLYLATPVSDPRRFDLDAPMSSQEVLDVYGLRILSVTELAIPAAQVEVMMLGHAGTASAVQRASRAIQNGHLQRVIVLGVDSYLDAPSLEWSLDRVKVADHPVGLMPGEAGACFLLEAEAAARRRGAPIHAVVQGATVGAEPNHLFTEEINLGTGLASAMAALLPEGAIFSGDAFVDLNGEEWRARELAGARVTLGPRFEPARLVAPASSLGETGAASGAIGVCLAARSFARGYDANGQALVTSSSEHGHVGAIRLSKT